MNTEQARVHISFKEGILEITGSEDFVARQVENFKDIVKDQFTKHEKTRHQTGEQRGEQRTNGSGGQGIEGFATVVAEHDGKISILKKVSGRSKQEKSTNTALVYLWAKSALGTDEVPFQEIRNACEQQGCLDSTNFATHMKDAKEFILITGTRKAQTAKLSIPGKEKALQVINELKAQ